MNCPNCNYPFERETQISGGEVSPPDPGDFTICFSCAEILCYDEAMIPRKPTPAQWQQIHDDPELSDILVRAVKNIKLAQYFKNLRLE